jgi:hypothetical protein
LIDGFLSHRGRLRNIPAQPDAREYCRIAVLSRVPGLRRCRNYSPTSLALLVPDRNVTRTCCRTAQPVPSCAGRAPYAFALAPPCKCDRSPDAGRRITTNPAPSRYFTKRSAVMRAISSSPVWLRLRPSKRSAKASACSRSSAVAGVRRGSSGIAGRLLGAREQNKNLANWAAEVRPIRRGYSVWKHDPLNPSITGERSRALPLTGARRSSGSHLRCWSAWPRGLLAELAEVAKTRPLPCLRLAGLAALASPSPVNQECRLGPCGSQPIALQARRISATKACMGPLKSRSVQRYRPGSEALLKPSTDLSRNCKTENLNIQAISSGMSLGFLILGPWVRIPPGTPSCLVQSGPISIGKSRLLILSIRGGGVRPTNLPRLTQECAYQTPRSA